LIGRRELGVPGVVVISFVSVLRGDAWRSGVTRWLRDEGYEMRVDLREV
jgi:hypothetical protein